MITAEQIDFSIPKDIIDNNEFNNLCSVYKCLSGITQVNFLCNLIENYKLPNNQNIKNVVELGTNLGLTSYFLLKTGVNKYGKDFKFHSFDLDNSSAIGSVVFENSAEEYKQRFILHKGMSFSDYCAGNENIYEQNKIDLAFVDAQHTHPGPILDVIYLLPFMKKGGLIAFHDINVRLTPDDWGACYVFDAFKGEKCLLKNDIIGYIVVPDNISTVYDMLLEVAKQPFKACIWIDNKYEHFIEREMPMLEKFLSKYYPADFAEQLLSIFNKNLYEYNENRYYLGKRSEFLKFMFDKVQELESRINYLSKELEDTRFESFTNKFFGNKVLLYGAGKNAVRLLNKYDFNKLNIVGISDIKFNTESEFYGYKTIHPTNINNTDYDYIILLVEDKNQIRQYLKNEFNISDSKIVEM